MEILSLVLGVDKRRGDEEPAPVLRMEWERGNMPHRSAFFELIDEAYAAIDLPYFPSGAWIVVGTERRRETVAVREAYDDPYHIGLMLWNGVETAATGYG